MKLKILILSLILVLASACSPLVAIYLMAPEQSAAPKPLPSPKN